MKDITGECDEPTASRYFVTDDIGNKVLACRCVICAQCKQHTGNANQGHYWAYCKITRRSETFHFCCPDACQLHPADSRELIS